MGLDVAQVSLDYLDRPRGAAYDFAHKLVDSCDAFGDDRAFGWFEREQLLDLANEYATDISLAEDGHGELLGWIASLPFDDEGYIHLGFV